MKKYMKIMRNTYEKREKMYMSKLQDSIIELNKGFATAFIDYSLNSNLAYRPEFISNNYRQGRKVLVSIEEELARCDEFCISVAFITKGGIMPLLQILKELENKNIPGKILTTDYLMFSEPAALETLAALKNIELKMFMSNQETGGFHTKGYIFRKEEIYRIIIGSSNMTLKAVTKNREWNTKLVSAGQGEITQQILSEFDELWKDTQSLPYTEFIEKYRQAYQKEKLIRKQKKQALQEDIVDLAQYTLEPNKMQVAFVENLMKMLRKNMDRALLLSSTGTGKTLASAFALREMNPKRALFLVHREQIAKQAMKSYRLVFGSSRSYGLLSGTSKDMDQEFLFATMQMMSKPDIYMQFSKDAFDVIVLDEYDIIGQVRRRPILKAS